MAKTSIDDLAIILSASSDRLAGDLRAAAKLVENFKNTVDKSGAAGESAAAKSAAKEAAANKRAAAASAAEQKRAARDAREAWEKSFVGRGAAVGKNFASSVASAAGSVPFAGLAIGVGAAATIVGIHGLSEALSELKDSVNMAADLEMTTLAFEVMLKSGDRATKMLADIRQFAAQTPFNTAELTDSSRKLIAYGLAADQIIPTLRMLGDVSAATQTPIGDLSYLYGTLAAQQRAYTKDIYQFANRGIPIYEELAKVLKKSVTETKDLIEEGRVGFPEVVRAFKAMTEGSGRYAGLTARQADTFAGVREQLTDAIQVGKIKLGKIIIDEMGLKDAAKDLQRFVENIDSHMDRIRPVVRFFGDLGRSVGQVSYEFGRAAINGGMFFDRISGAQFPELSRFLKDVREFVASGKGFKIDPLVVNEAIFMVQDELTSLFISVLKGIKSIGDGLRNDVLKPVMQGFQDMMGTWIEAKDLIGRSSTAERYRPPASFEADESVVQRYRSLMGELIHVQQQLEPLVPKERVLGAGKVEIQPLAKPLNPVEETLRDALLAREKELKGLREGYLKAFTTPENFPFVQHKLIQEGVVPTTPTRGGGIVLGEDGSMAGLIKSLTDGQKEAKRIHEEIKNRSLDERARQRQVEERQRQAREAAEQSANALTGLAGGAMFAAGELAKVKAPMLPEVPWAIRPDVLDAAKQAKEQYKDPAKEFAKQWNDLGEALLEGALTPMAYDRAAAELIRKTGQTVMPPTPLPDGAIAGTTEAVRLINRAMAGERAQQTTNDFLGRLVKLAEEQAKRDQDLIRKSAIPITVAAPR